jgi:hypothetical protein
MSEVVKLDVSLSLTSDADLMAEASRIVDVIRPEWKATQHQESIEIKSRFAHVHLVKSRCFFNWSYYYFLLHTL